MKNLLRKWLGVDLVMKAAQANRDSIEVLTEQLEIVESAVGPALIDAHERFKQASTGKKSQRYDEIERERSRKRKGQ